jgi:hypothetical protein
LNLGTSGFAITPVCEADYQADVFIKVGAVPFRKIMTLQCLAKPEPISYTPSSIHMWYRPTNSLSNGASLRNALLTVHSLMQISKSGVGGIPPFSIAATSLNSQGTSLVDGETTTDFFVVQALLNTVMSTDFQISSFPLADPCNHIAATHPKATTTSVIIVAGDFAPASCTTAQKDAAIANLKALQTKTDVIIINDGFEEASLKAVSATTIGYPANNKQVTKLVLEKYGIYRFQRWPFTCAGPVVTTPTSIRVSVMEDGLVYFNGVCGVAKCCVNDYCSTDIIDGGFGCRLPLVPTSNTESLEYTPF